MNSDIDNIIHLASAGISSKPRSLAADIVWLETLATGNCRCDLNACSADDCRSGDKPVCSARMARDILELLHGELRDLRKYAALVDE